MKTAGLILLIVTALSQSAGAINADSLGGNPWTSYMRTDEADTAYGAKWFPDSLVLGTYSTGAVNLPFVTHLFGYNNIGDSYWSQIDLYGDGILMAHPLASTGGIGFNAQEQNPDHVLIQLDAEVPLNTYGHLLRLNGNGYPSPAGQVSELMTIGQIGKSGIGLSLYNAADRSLGIYIDQGGTGSAIRIENNSWSTGNGLYIDNNNTGTALRIDDVTGVGRMIYTCQDSSRPPAFTAFYRGGQSGLSDDSSMFYWWGLMGHKVEVETIKTSLCGLRTFTAGNLCDTIPAPGVAESTTVVTANYAGGFESVTCNSLRIKVGPGRIIVKRGSTTDPDQYYWQATLMLGSNQIQGPTYPPPSGKPIRFSLFPNPSSGMVTASYALDQPGPVELGVYNLLGQKVRTVVNQWQPAGYYSIQWDGKNEQGRKTSAGVYLYQLKAAGSKETQKMVLIK